jgi:hypothetical protein
MLEGASVRISPSWLPGDVVICDISWDTDDLDTMAVPQGQWNSTLALLGGFGTSIGQWDWYRDTLVLELWVPNPLDPLIRHLIASLDGFTMPARNGDAGSGTLQPNLAPTTATLDFGWEVAAIY